MRYVKKIFVPQIMRKSDWSDKWHLHCLYTYVYFRLDDMGANLIATGTRHWMALEIDHPNKGIF